MATLKIEMPDEMRAFADSQVATGRYDSINAFVLHLMEQERERQVQKFQELRREIAVGLEQADRGELVPAEEVFARLRERNTAAK